VLLPCIPVALLCSSSMSQLCGQNSVSPRNRSIQLSRFNVLCPCIPVALKGHARIQCLSAVSSFQLNGPSQLSRFDLPGQCFISTPFGGSARMPQARSSSTSSVHSFQFNRSQFNSVQYHLICPSPMLSGGSHGDAPSQPTFRQCGHIGRRMAAPCLAFTGLPW
jgi:hypothetical protein